jgi:hypothetical protein
MLALERAGWAIDSMSVPFFAMADPRSWWIEGQVRHMYSATSQSHSVAMDGRRTARLV